MVKVLFMFVVLVANILLIVSSTGTLKSKVTHSSDTSSSVARSSRSHSASNYDSSQNSNECDDDGKSKKHHKETSDGCSKHSKKCKANETYVECPDFTCDPKTCDELGFPQPCPEHDENAACPGKPACLCVTGFLRNDDGVCVPRKECPSCGGDPNAVAGCGIHCGRFCPNYKEKPSDCTKICKVNSCDCKPGFLFDNNIGKCVEPDDCSKECKANETYVECPDFTCGPKTCDELGFPQPCPEHDENAACPGKPACLCVTGYLRNYDGVCVPRTECPSCGGDPNAVAGCGIHCGRFCPNYKEKPSDCAEICKLNSCDCKPDFLFDNNIGKCVDPEDCTPACGKNEEYSSCTNGGCFGAKTCSEIGKPVICVRIDPAYCKKGCVCQHDHLRDKDGVCIPQDQCPNNTSITCNNPNEVYDPCPPFCPAQKCSVDTRLIKCAPYPNPGDPECEPSCRCIEGYLRDDEEVCIPKDQCPPFCGQNEIPSNCINGGCFGARTCSEIGKPVRCVKLDPASCIKGCICQDDYLRNEDDICIPQSQCPNNSNTTCENPCGKNEVFDTCPATCPPLRCDVDPRVIKCGPNPEPGDPECEPGCRCAAGHLRNDKGVCIPKDECPQHCGDNEIYSSCYNGGCYGARKCAEIGRPIICVDLLEGACKGGCICKKTFLRNENGICIPEDECPNNSNETCTGDNEYYDPCPPACYPKTCDEIDLKFKCPPGDCKPACRCISDYYRNGQGICVSEKECRSNTTCENPCGKNEVFDTCPATCPPLRCDVDPRLIDCAPNPNPGDPECEPGCRCAAGHLRNDQGICIYKDKCPQHCGDNEIYSSCVNGGCFGARNCSEKGQPEACLDLREGDYCRGGCICQDAYLRNEDGICIPEDECPNSNETCTGVNEYYDPCPPACYPKTCDEIDLKFKCPPGDCKPACRCISDYYRNSQGICVSEKECRSTTCKNPNEVYDPCPAICPPQECGVDPALILCRPNPKVGDPECEPGCRCADDYLRNDEGVCVLKDQCPVKCADFNEEYVKCPITCPPQTCEAIGKVYPCPLIKSDCQGPGACQCKSGFYRNALNKCISKENCLKCSGPNEYFSCGGACDNVCATLSQQNQTNCPIINRKCNEMCYCKEEYARDANNTCILIENCPKLCSGPNEYYACAGACDNVCATLSQQNQTNCPIVNKKCNEMCYCDEGYARDANNTCILIKNCPKPTCGRNEEFSECKQECVCRPRYFRAKDGTCRPKKNNLK